MKPFHGFGTSDVFHPRPPRRAWDGALRNAYATVCQIGVRHGSGQRREFGTGFLIAPRAVATCAHVIEGIRKFKRKHASGVVSVAFRFGPGGAVHFMDELATSLPHKWKAAREEGSEYDVGVVQLRSRPPSRVALPLAGPMGSEVEVPSHPKRVATLMTASGPFRSASGIYLHHKASTRRGSSGAPILQHGSGGRTVICGIHAAGIDVARDVGGVGASEDYNHGLSLASGTFARAWFDIAISKLQ